MIIAIEGMDGVGKTTVAKKIAEQEELLYIDKPLKYFFNDSSEEDYADLMKMANKVYGINDSVIRSWFIGLGNIACFRNNRDRDFIIDRHLVSNYFWNGDDESNVVFSSMINTIGVPDLTVILYATPNTRMDRLRKRDPNDKDLDDPEKRVDGYEKMIQFVQAFNIPYVVIDTESKTVDCIVDEIIGYIRNIRNADGESRVIKKC